MWARFEAALDSVVAAIVRHTVNIGMVGKSLIVLKARHTAIRAGGPPMS